MLVKDRIGFCSRCGLIAFIAVIIMLFLSLAVVPSAFAYDDEELAFLTYINNHRAAYGLGPLTLSNSLYVASEGHSYDMGTRNYFAHNDPQGVTPWDRIRYAGYTYNTYLGENIAAGYATAHDVFVAWRASPGHNTNMLSANFRAIGIGRYYVPGSTYGWYWTTDFGGVAEAPVYPVDASVAGKWNALGGAPGPATNYAQVITGGKYQDFVNGRLVWNESRNDVFWVKGAILTKFDQLGTWSSPLGLPISDEGDVNGVAGARKTEFTNGTIYWGSGIGAFSVIPGTVVADSYLAQGGPAGAYGLPLSDEFAAAGGRAQYYQRAVLTWDGTANPAYVVVGGIMGKYKILGGPTGSLGLATGNEADVPGVTGARQSVFTGGTVYWGPGVGAYGITAGPIMTKYLAEGGPAGIFGLPVSDEYAAWDGKAQNMQKAIITWNSRLGAQYVRGGVMGKYQLMGGPTGALHLIISEEAPISDVPGAPEAVEAVFQNGRVYWSLNTGSNTVNGGVYVRYMGYCDAGNPNACGPKSRLGLPITDEYALALPGGGARSRFQHGFITWWALYGTWIDVT